MTLLENAELFANQNMRVNKKKWDYVFQSFRKRS